MKRKSIMKITETGILSAYGDGISEYGAFGRRFVNPVENPESILWNGKRAS